MTEPETYEGRARNEADRAVGLISFAEGCGDEEQTRHAMREAQIHATLAGAFAALAVRATIELATIAAAGQ